MESLKFAEGSWPHSRMAIYSASEKVNHTQRTVQDHGNNVEGDLSPAWDEVEVHTGIY
jgi:hypothetical protein